MKTLLAVMAVNALYSQQGVRVQGTVVNSVSQEPLPKTMVVLRSRDIARGTNYATESGGGGKFSIDSVAPGAYGVTAERQGFTTALSGTEGEPPLQITVEAGKDFFLTLKMVPRCVIAGRVLDDEGDPVRSAQVKAMRYLYVGGKRQLTGTVQVMTDDRGDYRLFGLAAGRFYIQAVNSQRGMPDDARTASPYLPTFFPNANDPAGAIEVNVAAGGEARGIDIKLHRARVYLVRGTAPNIPRDPQGHIRPDIGRSIRLISVNKDANVTDIQAQMTLHDETGAFEFVNVPPGSYLLIAEQMEGASRSYARQIVRVGGADVTGLSIVFASGRDVTGKVTFDSPTGHDFQNIRVRLISTTPYLTPPAPAIVNADGTFVIHDVAADEFELSTIGSAGTYLKSIRIGDRAASGRQVDFTQDTAKLSVVLGTDFGDIEGTVKTASGGPAVGVRVTAIPSGGNLGRMELSRFAFTDEKGTFHIKNVPPGDYKMFAWDKVQVGAPQDPEFRKPYEKLGTEIKLASKGHETVELNLVHVLNP